MILKQKRKIIIRIMNKISWWVIGGIGLGILFWLGWSGWRQTEVKAPASSEEIDFEFIEPTEGPGDLIPTEPLPSN